MNNESENVVEVANLVVKYGAKTAVDELSFNLKKGQSLGLLGLNGAGKSSTIRALLGMVRPQSGKALVFGQKPGSQASLSQLGFAPEDGTPPDFLTTLEYLEFVYAFKVKKSSSRRKECEALLNWFELATNKKVQDLSKGMNRRLILAQAFIGKPSLLILDEPLNGLDPLMIIKLRDKLDTYRKNGGTVLYCSHILSEVERSCSDILVLRDGKISYANSVTQAITEYGDVEKVFAKFAGNSGGN